LTENVFRVIIKYFLLYFDSSYCLHANSAGALWLTFYCVRYACLMFICFDRTAKRAFIL